MKKAFGFAALVAAAAAVVVYKIKKDEEKQEVIELDEDGERILRTVEEQGFEPINYDGLNETFTQKTFANLDGNDVIVLTEASEKRFASIEGVEADEECPIQHTIHFDTPEDVEEFKNVVISEGYVVTTGEEENQLLVLHISRMDQDDIVAKVLYLADLAKANHGVYEGWICKK